MVPMFSLIYFYIQLRLYFGVTVVIYIKRIFSKVDNDGLVYCQTSTTYFAVLYWWNVFKQEEEGVEITANSLHPGAINTNLFRQEGFVNGNNSNFSWCAFFFHFREFCMS